MSSQFYQSIIEEERKVFNVKEDNLKTATKAVGTAYSRKALDKGSTFLDYNHPANRCAYLFKFAAIHTAMVANYFDKMLTKKKNINIFLGLERLKICCLGGGPGTDIVGLFKALTKHPQFRNKVVEVVVLDICGGWRNSFKLIISGLLEGKVKGVPTTFCDGKNLKSKLIQVNLLEPLPANVQSILSTADIICSVKFISAIFGNSASSTALKDIATIIKPKAVIFFIDNLAGAVYKLVENISVDTGLNIIYGPMHANCKKKSKKDKIFGSKPLFGTMISVIGMVKSSVLEVNKIDAKGNYIHPTAVKPCSTNTDTTNEDDDDSWNTESENEETIFHTFIRNKPLVTSQERNSKVKTNKAKCDKFVQTSDSLLNDSMKHADELNRTTVKSLESLATALEQLIAVTNRLILLNTCRTHCHCKCNNHFS